MHWQLCQQHQYLLKIVKQQTKVKRRVRVNLWIKIRLQHQKRKKVVEYTKNETAKTEKEKELVVVEEDNSKKEAISNKEKVEEVPKNGWQRENGEWLFYENNQPIKNWKKLRVSGISLINMESWPAILLLMTIFFVLVEQW